MEATKDFICFTCKHNVEGENGCKAFPDGIPDEITLTNKHNKPLKNQKNDLVYVPIDKATRKVQ